LVGGCRPRVAAPPGPNTMPPVGLGTSEDRSLEEAIKNAALRPSPPVPNPLLRCLQCLQLPLPAEGTSEASIAGVEARLVGDYHTSDTGEQGTLEWRRFVYDADGRQISYWHDLPLSAGARMLHAFIEIPKNTRAKYEVCRTEATNPIKQDEKRGKPRFYNLDIKWNYGAFPQTWEQPDHAWKGLDGYGGDDDPVDVVDISSEAVAPGSIIVCKPLAALAMIDEGEVDWKIAGVQYRKSKCLNDRYLRYAKLGTVVSGVVEDNGEWLRIRDDVFLPMKVNGMDILERLPGDVAPGGAKPKSNSGGGSFWFACGQGSLGDEEEVLNDVDGQNSQ